jgi:hypothetical protein
MLTYKTAQLGGTLHKVPAPRHLQALLGVRLRHARQPGEPSHVRVQEPGLRLVGQR